MRYVKKWLVHFAISSVFVVNKLLWRGKYTYVLPPASAGSLGDEALLAGLRGLLGTSNEAAPLRQVTFPTWEPLECLELVEHVTYVTTSDTVSTLRYILSLIFCRHFMVLGADIMDGRYSPALVKNIVSLCNIAAKTGMPVSILGFSFSSTPNRHAIDALKDLDPNVTCFCRDPVSLERFLSYTGHSAELVADLSFHMKPMINSATVKEAADWIRECKGNGARILGFNVNRLVKTDQTDLTWSYAASLEKVMAEKEDFYCVLLPHDLRQEQSDHVFLAEVRNALPSTVRKRTYLPTPPFNAWDIKGLAGMSDLVVAGRMHLAISAISQGVPAVGIAYQGKFDGLYRYFEATGLLFDPVDLACPDALAGHILAAISKLDSFRAGIEKNLPKVIELSARNVTLPVHSMRVDHRG